MLHKRHISFAVELAVHAFSFINLILNNTEKETTL